MAPSPEEGLPEVSDVVAEYRARVRDRGRRRPEGLLGRLSDLHETNVTQWTFEDSVRSFDDDDTMVANAKREIDVLNERRHHLVEAIDAAIDEALSQVPSATPSTESPGMVFDRLSVLVISHLPHRASCSRGPLRCNPVRDPPARPSRSACHARGGARRPARRDSRWHEALHALPESQGLRGVARAIATRVLIRIGSRAC